MAHRFALRSHSDALALPYLSGSSHAGTPLFVMLSSVITIDEDCEHGDGFIRGAGIARIFTV
ncbi:MAG: hypothetical protein GWP10_16275 [Nitrospiraceae bacterium]|nr:hypothetical protein [Nitrospiraceae bacterium]